MSRDQSLGEVFKNMFRDLGIEKPIEQHKAVALWPSAVGERVAQVTEVEKIEHGVLTVRVASPVWRNELIFMKREIIDKLNTAVKKHVVKDINFT